MTTQHSSSRALSNIQSLFGKNEQLQNLPVAKWNGGRWENASDLLGLDSQAAPAAARTEIILTVNVGAFVQSKNKDCFSYSRNI